MTQDTPPEGDATARLDAQFGEASAAPDLKPEKPRLLIAVDVERYAHFLEHVDASDEDKAAFIEAMWRTIVGFIELGFGVHPTQQTSGQLPEKRPQTALTAPDVVSYPVENTTVGKEARS